MLLVLGLLALGVAPTPAAQAQSATAYSVPADWALVPAGLKPGDTFRLLFSTNGQRDAQSTDIADYNSFVQGQALGGHQSIGAYAHLFKVVGSTSAVAARDNTDPNVNSGGAGEPIYWLGGDRIADDYADFYDGSWDSHDARDEDGDGFVSTLTVYTGSNDDGTAATGAIKGPLGQTRVMFAQASDTLATTQTAGTLNTFNRRFYAMSPVFKVVAAPVANSDGSYNVPPNWALKPSAVGTGSTFRLLFITSQERVPNSSDIADYNAFVQRSAAVGHADIQGYHQLFKAVGSTSTVDARDNTDTNTSSDGAGEPIYWLTGPKVADDYADFYDNSWDNTARADIRNEIGSQHTASGVVSIATGSKADGTKNEGLGFGNTAFAQFFGVSYNSVLGPGHGSGSPSSNWNYYALSPVFKVADTEISIGFPTGDNISKNQDGDTVVKENFVGTTVGIDVTSNPQLSADITVCLRITESGGDRIAAGFEGITTVIISGGANRVVHNLEWVDDAIASPHSRVLIEVVPPGMAGCTGGGNYAASATMGVGVLIIEENERPSLVAFAGLRGSGEPGRYTRPACDLLIWDEAGATNSYKLYFPAGSAATGTITVTATVSDFTLAGLALTSGGSPQQSLTLAFEQRGPTDAPNTGYFGCGPWEPSPGNRFDLTKGDGTDNNLNTSLRCVREIFVVRKVAPSSGGCVDITHTASGGNVRAVQANRTTIRAHTLSHTDADHGFYNADGTYRGVTYSSGCSRITADAIWNYGRSAASEAPDVEPTYSISSSVTSATEGDELAVTINANPAPSVDTTVRLRYTEEYGEDGTLIGATRIYLVTIPAGQTSVTHRHTLHDDEVDRGGGSVVISLHGSDGYALAGVAQLTIPVTDDEAPVQQVGTQQQQAAGEGGGGNDGGTTPVVCVVTLTADKLVDKVRRYHNQNKNRPTYNHNWYRVLIAFGAETHDTLTPFTAAEAVVEEQIWTGWTPVRQELERLESEAAACAAQSGGDDGQQGGGQQQEDDPPPPPPPPPPEEVEEDEPALSAAIETALNQRVAAAKASGKAARVARWERLARGLTGQDGGMTVTECRAFQARGPVWTRVWTPFCHELARLRDSD